VFGLALGAIPLWGKVAAGVVLAAAIAWLAHDYAWRGGEIDRLQAEQLRLEGELREAVIANQSLIEARQRAERRHAAENAARDRLAALQRQQQADLVDLAKALAALPAGADCTGGEALQDLIDGLRGVRE